MASEKFFCAARRPPLPPSRVRIPDRTQLPSLGDPETQEVLQSVIDGRKDWKTIRGGEIVWPPELEGALIEGKLQKLDTVGLSRTPRLLDNALATGLERYEPDNSRETRFLGRYPMRNRFISDYIFKKTGVRRTAKQVGSRLQQLRGTATGEKLKRLLLPCGPVPSRKGQESPSDESDVECSASDACSPPATPVDVVFPRPVSSGKLRRCVVLIDILPDVMPRRTSSSISEEYSPTDVIVRPSSSPRLFRYIDPTITLIGPSNLSATSSYVVRIRGVDVFKEITYLTCIGPAPDGPEGSLLYATKLVPGFWHMISKSADPTQYSIFQEVIRDGLDSSPVFLAVYKFRYPPEPPPETREPSPASSTDYETR